MTFFVELDGFAIDIVAFAHDLGGFEFAETLLDVFHLGVNILGSELDGTELGVDLAPVNIELRSQSGIEIEGEVGVVGKVHLTGLLVVGKRGADNLEFLIVDVFVERLT